jgi:hypothetical protein
MERGISYVSTPLLMKNKTETTSLSATLDSHRRSRPALVINDNLSIHKDPSPSSSPIRVSVEAKTDTDGTSDLKRHPDLWFTDGSVVLRAENTLFKVHISQLSRHSVLFHDLFTLPQAKESPLTPVVGQSPHSNSLAKLDGRPVVHLHDIAEDVGNLLTALYDGPCVASLDMRFSLLKCNLQELR